MSMVISHFSVFILSIFLLSNVLITQSSNEINKPLIDRTCKKISANTTTISLQFCSSSLESATDHPCMDVRCLALVSINLLRHNVTSAHGRVKTLMQNKGLEPYVRSCLDDCFELYSIAISTAEEAMKAYKTKKYADANVAVTSMMNAAMGCEDGFKDKKGVRSPLTKSNTDAFGLGSVVLAIMSFLH